MLDGYGTVQVLRNGECHGRSVLCRAPFKDAEQSSEHHVVFGGTTLSTGPDNIDEELFVRGNRVVWSSGGLVRKQFTTALPVTQVTWCRFLRSGGGPLLCMLQKRTLTLYSTSGELHTVTVPGTVTHMTPLQQGLLLTGQHMGPMLLTEPLQQLHQVPIEGSHAWQQDERVIWADVAVPLLATRSSVPGLEEVSGLTLWQIRHQQAPAQASTPRPLRTPPLHTRSPGATPRVSVGAPGSTPGPKRSNLRRPDGTLSPMAFSPQPRSSLPGTSGASGAQLLLPSSDMSTVLKGFGRQRLPKGMQSTSACLTHNDEGNMLLCLHGGQQLLVHTLKLQGQGASCEAAFALPHVQAAAAVAATRPGEQGLKDLLVLHMPASRLALYVGQRLVCNLLLPAGSLRGLPRTTGQWPSAVPTTATTEAEDGGAHAAGSEGMALSRTASDASMEEEEGEEEPLPASHSHVGPDLGALQDALDHPPAVIGMQDAVGSRVTLVLEHGQTARVDVQSAPAGRLPRAACQALAEVLPPATWHAMTSKYILRRGDAGPGAAHAEQEWAQLAHILREWVTSPASLSQQGFRQVPAGLTSSSEVDPTPTPTPGGSMDSSSDVAWEALLHSDHHRVFVTKRAFPCLSVGLPSSGHADMPQLVASQAHANRGDLWPALQALHSIYEEFKLNVLDWHLLPQLGSLLLDMSLMLGATDLVDHYLRDLGPSAGRKGAAAARQAPADQPPPASIHQALQSLLAGRPHGHWVPLLAQRGSQAVRRSCMLLELYGAFSHAGRECAAGLARYQQLAPGTSQSGQALEQLSGPLQRAAEDIVLLMVDQGWTLSELDTLPVGIALPLREVFQRSRQSPPSGWPAEAYLLIGRDDIAATVAAAMSAADASAAGKARSAPGPEVATPQWPGTTPHQMAPLGRTPFRQPNLSSSIPGGKRGRSRLSMNASAASPLPVPHFSFAPTADSTPAQAASAAADAAAHISRQPSMGPEDMREAPGLAQDQLCGLSLPYTQRLQTPGLGLEDKERDPLNLEPGQPPDGLDNLDAPPLNLRFGKDLRLVEVRCLLASANPTPVVLHSTPEVGDVEVQALQQAKLLALSFRTMALPLGRGALTLGMLQPVPTEAIHIPALCLAGRLPLSNNAVMNLDLTSAQVALGGGAAADVTAWPEFHNGVAAGIRLVPGGVHLTRAWIVFNKPKIPNYTHAGLLMGLGLMGHLSCLSATDLYRYLSQEHDATTVGTLLGMAAAKRGTLDATVGKMLFLHIPSRHPTSYPELELSPLVQAAALLGVGLLYQGSCHRLTAEIMMEEIARRPGGGGGEGSVGATHGAAVSQDRESYALAAGLALGLITLGRGRSHVGISDLQLEARLRYFMVGGSDAGMVGSRSVAASGASGSLKASLRGGPFGPGGLGFDPTLGEDAGSMPPIAGETSFNRSGQDPNAQQSGVSQVVLEGKLVNLDVTSPAATMALALMFLKTNDQAVGSSFTVPQTHFALDYVRPDFILLRVFARGLVLWDSVQPTREWVQAQLPEMLQGPLSKFMAGEICGSSSVDWQALGQAHTAVVAGACLALGVRHAGSASAEAEGVLRHYLLYLLEAKRQAPERQALGGSAAWGRLDKHSLESCIGVVALALSVVMAGTGHLPTFKLLRALRRRLCAPVPTATALQYPSLLGFGQHMAISMALGMLFLAAGSHTFGTSNSQVAALVIALFPKLPQSTTDHRCHLQAFRHLYVLAAERRCMQAVDVDTREPVYAPLNIHLQPPGAAATSQVATKPPRPPQARAPGPCASTGPQPLHLSPSQAAARDATSAAVGQHPLAAVGVSTARPAQAAAPAADCAGGDSDEAVTAVGNSFSRTAPCLLPEQDQVMEVSVCGPRYWQHSVSGAAEAGNPLAACYSAGALHVQRRAGVLSYADDPSGIRSLLSKAFRRGSGMDSDSDLAQLCATFSASPFIMAFAQHICTSRSSSTSLTSHGWCSLLPLPCQPQEAAGSSAAAMGTQAQVGGTGGLLQHQATPGMPAQACLQADERFQALCRSALFRCTTEERPAMLMTLLFLHATVQAALLGQGPTGTALADQSVGLAPTIPLWSLKMARAYAHSSWSAACSAISKGLPADTPAETRKAWAALLPADFVEGLWQQLQGLWVHMAFCRPAAAASPAQAAAPVAAAQSPGPATRARAAALASAARQAAHMRPLVLDYLQTGRMPDTDAVPGLFHTADQAWPQELFGTFLSLSDIPGPRQTEAATSAAQSLCRAMSPSQADSALVPFLALTMPNTPLDVLHLIAASL